MEGMEGVLALSIPIVFLIATAAVVAIWFQLRYRGRRDVLETVRAAIDKGQPLTPELIERLTETPQGPERDLRRGVVLIAVGLGIAILGAAISRESVVQPLALGAVPLLIGVAYLGLWRFMPRS
jgi:hypothetical protein